MKRNVKVENRDLDDTFSITMELERPLLLNEEIKSLKESREKAKREKKKKLIFRGIITAIILSIIVFFIWVSKTYTPQSEAKLAMKSDEYVTVSNNDFISFTPNKVKATKGFILYPGAKIEPKSYAPLCKEIAKKGYEVVIVDMPFNIALFGINKAQSVIDKFDNIKTWSIGGHSLGGVAASRFAANNDKIDGVVFLASYPMGNELFNKDKKVMSIWGSLDGVLNIPNMMNSNENLPKSTKYVEIEGANHSQFGDYGTQTGDNKALITPKEQLEITSNNIVKLLNEIN